LKSAVFLDNNTTEARRFLCLVLAIYTVALCYSIFTHELWGDEIHSWNIAKASASVCSLLSNTRYEGHPPLWYFLLFIITKFSHNPMYMQIAHACICCAIAFLVLFHSGFSIVAKVLIIFGYYFIYEYATLSRNYSLGVLFAFSICIILNKEFKYKIPAYYFVLILLSNTHLLSLILGIAFHAYFILSLKTSKLSRAFHVILGALVLLPSIYFICPPSNSSLNGSFWITFFNKSQYYVLQNAPIRSFIPIPAWWKLNFWNTQCLIDLGIENLLKKIILFTFFIGIICSLFFILKKNTKNLIFFLINLSLTLSLALFFPLATQRYVGFIYISFICALWLLPRFSFTKIQANLIFTLLAVQFIGTLMALKKDFNEPFSQIDKISKIAEFVPAGQKMITDFWCLNYAVTALDKPMYCIGFDTEKQFLQWDEKSVESTRDPDLYLNGIKNYLNQIKKKECYLISTSSPADLASHHTSLIKACDLKTIVKEEGAIEKYSNLYLYKITLRNDFLPAKKK
jgi:hypothetical protein